MKMRHVKPCMGPEWLHKLIHSLRVLWAFPNARWDPFALERKEKMLATHGTIDSARSSRAHHRPLIDLNDHDECCIGPKWRVHAHTPRVHGLTTPTHARRRAGHPLAGGRLYRQAKRRANHFGQTRELLAQETEHIGGRRQTGILAR